MSYLLIPGKLEANHVGNGHLWRLTGLIFSDYPDAFCRMRIQSDPEKPGRINFKWISNKTVVFRRHQSPLSVWLKINASLACSEDEFTCASGECISMQKRCDGFSNCLDDSDEQECNSKSCFKISQTGGLFTKGAKYLTPKTDNLAARSKTRTLGH